MSEILVTGAGGFLGKHLIQRLSANDHDITALDIKPEPPAAFAGDDNVTYISGSILHEEFVDTMVFPSPNSYDRIYHLAAIVGVDRYADPEDLLYIVDVNINGTKKLLERVRGSNTRFVYTSTSEIFGKNQYLPWAEDDDRVLGPPSESRWSYSSTKAICEHMVSNIGQTDPGVSTTIVRPFNLYGPGQRPQFVIPKFLEQVSRGDVPTVYGNGTQKRCFTFIDDFVEGIVRASKRDHDGTETYNLGSTDETEIRELAELVLDVAGMEDREPAFVDPGDDHQEPDRRIPDVSRAKDRLDWEVSTQLREGLEQTLETKTPK
ncbi:NAD-dependent epimerase/dehydratase family protein [Halosimplex pelagicum]|uniref:NAD(P)-dependent oxidoreductase n=1 Tax=Halosimplex pelagicum TaxID=869886 RepID=A0A7D5P5E5_9EURY|nr:NAD(P)-dependent oxidoreductase [Halosimplex pelagicum]QLH81203.1 NAD(P)-dependent oxidoreductase [Halosimplex pelagicum]